MLIFQFLSVFLCKIRHDCAIIGIYEGFRFYAKIARDS